jgi:hypothetical protein
METCREMTFAGFMPTDFAASDIATLSEPDTSAADPRCAAVMTCRVPPKKRAQNSLCGVFAAPEMWASMARAVLAFDLSFASSAWLPATFFATWLTMLSRPAVCDGPSTRIIAMSRAMRCMCPMIAE